MVQDQIFEVAFFSSEKDNSPRREVVTWDPLVAKLSAFDTRKKKSGPCWSPTRYTPEAKRGNAGVQAITVAVLDVDDGTDPEALRTKLVATGLAYLIHSTFSSTPECPKYRVVVPLASPVPVAEWPGVFPRLCALLADGHTDPATKDSARIFYLPSARPGAKTFLYVGEGRAVGMADLSPAPAEATGLTQIVSVPLEGGKLPHRKHYRVIVSLAASYASRLQGITEEVLVQSLKGALAPLLDDLPKHETQIRNAARSALAKYGGGKRKSATDRLIEIGTTEARLFHDSSKETYALLRAGDHEETHRIRSVSFRHWLIARFYEEMDTAPRSEDVRCALEDLGAKAEFKGPTEEVYLRVAYHAGDLWIDLGTADWNAIHVTSSGWSVVSKAPVHFVRGRTCQPFPAPERDGSLRALLPYLNAANVEDPHFVLSVAWVLGAFHPKGPYPILVLNGEQGSGKSTSSRFLRALVDPSSLPVRSAPKEERDLAVAAQGNRVVAFDNLSSLSDWLSDALCRLSTGGGFGTRQLYTDDEEVVFGGTRPILINGIPMMGDAADFRDRALPCAWPLLSTKRRERDLEKDFARESPAILGAILDALVMALAHVNDPASGTDFRMADFAAWVIAAGPALPWPPGTFEKVYTAVQQRTVEEAVADNPLAQALLKLTAQQERWEGCATDLLSTLASLAIPAVNSLKPPSWWPKSPKALGHALKRLAPDLRRVGVGVEKTVIRTWIVSRAPPLGKWAGTNDTNDQTITSPRETGNRLGCRLPFGDHPETTDHPPSVVSPSVLNGSTSPQWPQTITAVDVVSAVSVVSSRPFTASPPDLVKEWANRQGVPVPPSGPVPEESHLGDGPTLAGRALANARREGSLAPDPPLNPYYYPPEGWKPGEAPKEEVPIEGVEGARIRGGEVIYDPPLEGAKLEGGGVTILQRNLSGVLPSRKPGVGVRNG